MSSRLLLKKVVWEHGGAVSCILPDAEIIISTFVLYFVVWSQNICLDSFCNGRDSERDNHSDLIAPRPIPSPRVMGWEAEIGGGRRESRGRAPALAQDHDSE